LEVADLLPQTLVLRHLGTGIYIVDTIHLVQGNRIAEEVVGFEGRVYAEDAIASGCSLNVMEEYGDHGHIPAEELTQEVLVQEYFVYPVLAGGFDRADYLRLVKQLRLRGNDSLQRVSQ